MITLSVLTQDILFLDANFNLLLVSLLLTPFQRSHMWKPLKQPGKHLLSLPLSLIRAYGSNRGTICPWHLNYVAPQQITDLHRRQMRTFAMMRCGQSAQRASFSLDVPCDSNREDTSYSLPFRPGVEITASNPGTNVYCNGDENLILRLYARRRIWERDAQMRSFKLTAREVKTQRRNKDMTYAIKKLRVAAAQRRQ